PAVPNLCHLIATGSHEAFSIRAEADAFDGVGATQLSDFVLGGQVPKAGRQIAAPGDGPRTVGVECRISNPIRMRPGFANGPAAGGVPQARGVVPAAGEQTLAVRAEHGAI